jgi:periplasmic divalent cation tolerance protein
VTDLSKEKAAGFIQVVTTTDSKESADRIAHHLLERRLAGCVQIAGPITSSYWWEGRIQTAEEWYCVIKTAKSRYADVEREIRAVHGYDEPEILSFAVTGGSATYLAWLAAALDQ